MAVLRALPDHVNDRPTWTFGLDLRRYDRRTWLTDGELTALRDLGPAGLRRGRHRGAQQREPLWDVLARLVQPLDDARAVLRHRDDAAHRRGSADAAGLVLLRCGQVNRSYWAFTREDWRQLLHGDAAGFRASMPWPVEPSVRPFAVALAYLLGGFDDFHELGTFNRMHLAALVFGDDAVRRALGQVSDVLAGWGYRGVDGSDHRLTGAFSQLLLLNRSPLVADLTDDAFTRLRQHPSTTAAYHRQILFAAHRAAAASGYCQPPARAGHDGVPRIEGTGQEWSGWLERWYTTSTLTVRVRAIVRCIMAKAGRWLAAEHPHITDPSAWTRQTCAAWVAAVDRMRVGDYVQRRDALGGRVGTPILPRTKAHILMASRTFFRDCQEWEWMPRRFDPATALAVPRSVNALIGTNPRIIADDVWAKLLWAGMNLTEHDIPGGSAHSYYPMALIRAVTLTWLFAGLRSDEVRRLRVGCIRWQHNGFPIPGNSPDVLADEAVCLLDVPVHKTGTAFTKPVDPLVGQAIEAWQSERPHQPNTIDRRTGEHVDMLFAVRAQPIATIYLNRTIIPALCRKAGVPGTDVRGRITSHRARSTIASQLYNAKEPMTLFELQAWLGHRTPTTTQHYAKITPNTLAKAYNDAGYFARNTRTIEVLIDRDAVNTDQPWQHYDLGHGYCTYSFFEQCPHRMACARCDFYTPKGSTKAQLLEAKTNLQRMLATIPPTDDERAAVEDGQAALDGLLNRLAHVATPAGPTPTQIGIPPTATHLPLIDITHSNIEDH
jgi:integrase